MRGRATQSAGRATRRLDGPDGIPHADQGVQRRFQHVLGIDLGGGKSKNTALATLRVDGRSATVVDIAPRTGAPPFYDPTLLDTIRGYGDDTLLCIDAPLTLPPCLRCTVPVCPGQQSCVDPSVVEMRALAQEAAAARNDRRDGYARTTRDMRRGKPSITPYTQRTTEVYLARSIGIAAREGLGQGTGPLAARAAHLVRALADRFTLNENLIEVYPKATLVALGLGTRFKKHLRERETRARVLDSVSDQLRFGPGVWRELCVQSDHLFEAVICAFTGFLWARDGWSLPVTASARDAGERLRDGWIWTPPAAGTATETAPAKSAAEG
jgi:predicted RNase H-like nuclease